MSHLIKCTKDHLDDLRKIAVQTFRETYSDDNGEEIFEKYILTAFTKEKLIEELQNTASRFYILEEKGQFVAYLKLNWGNAQSSFKNHSLEIERIYVCQTHQGYGFGKMLIRKAIHIDREFGAEKLWLGVWQKNVNAISFYEKMGFLKNGVQTFMLAGEAQSDYIMELKI